MGDARVMAKLLQWYFYYLVISSIYNYFNPEVLKAEMLAYVHPLTKISITSEFGERLHPIYKVKKHHSGIDLRAKKGTPVRSILKGKVIFADFHGDYGNLVTILHEDNITSHYAHLSEINSKVSTLINQGELIGTVGCTGASTGSHLHLEIRKDGVLLNPEKVLYAFNSESKG